MLIKIISFFRYLIFFPLFLLHTTFCSLLVIVVIIFFGKSKFTDWVQSTLWAKFSLFLFSIKYKVKGIENIPKDEGIIFLFNHASYVDILILHAVIPRSFQFGAKIELFFIPIFSRVMKLLGVLAIDRSQREKVLELYKTSIKRIKNGESFALAPEGARQLEPKIGKFKKGPFIFAAQANATIIPIVMIGALDVLPMNKIIINADSFSKTVEVTFLKPIKKNLNLSEEDAWIDMQKRTKDQMIEMYDKINV